MPELLRLFFGLPESKVLEIRDRAVALIAEGKTLMEVKGQGKEGVKAFPMPPRDALFEANAALRALNPAKYGRRVRRTHLYIRNSPY